MNENQTTSFVQPGETKKCKYCQMDIPKKAKVCPNCKKNQKSRLKTIIIFIVVLFILFAIGSSGKSNNETSTKTSSVQTNVSEQKVKDEKEETEEEVIEYISCDVDELADVLSSNALKAEKTYCNQYLEVTGKLNTIDSDGEYISLYSINDEWDFTGVQCSIENEEQLNHVMELSTGDIITVRIKCDTVGEIIGYMGDIIEFVK